jgi:Tfp pilus assembly protein PilX
MILLTSFFANIRTRFAESRAPRGFTLLIALIFTSVILAVGLALLDITYKQVILSATARQSQYAFYAADSAMECALYWDNKMDEFDYSSEPVGTQVGNITCEGQTFYFNGGAVSSGSRLTTFNVPCAAGGSSIQASVSVYKSSTGGTSIFANGFNTCTVTDPQRIERGLESTY